MQTKIVQARWSLPTGNAPTLRILDEERPHETSPWIGTVNQEDLNDEGWGLAAVDPMGFRPEMGMHFFLLTLTRDPARPSNPWRLVRGRCNTPREASKEGGSVTLVDQPEGDWGVTDAMGLESPGAAPWFLLVLSQSEGIPLERLRLTRAFVTPGYESGECARGRGITLKTPKADLAALEGEGWAVSKAVGLGIHGDDLDALLVLEASTAAVASPGPDKPS